MIATTTDFAAPPVSVQDATCAKALMPEKAGFTPAECSLIREGIALFEKATVAQAESYQCWLSGKTLKVLPFEPDQPSYLVQVKEPIDRTFRVIDQASRLLLGGLNIEHKAGQAGTYTVLNGWLRKESYTDEPSFGSPRLTDDGGLVEKACYLLCAAGLAAIDSAEHLEDNIEEGEDAFFTGGYLRLVLLDVEGQARDALTVGLTGNNTLTVLYERDQDELYRLSGPLNDKLSVLVGCLLAPVIHVRDMGAAQKTNVSTSA